MLVELMSKDSKLPCFALGDLTAANLRDRFQLGWGRNSAMSLWIVDTGECGECVYQVVRYVPAYDRGVL